MNEAVYEFIQCLTIFFAIWIGIKNNQSINRQDETWAEAMKSVREHFKVLDKEVFK